MKQKDIALIAVIGFVALVAGLLLSNMVFSSSSKRTMKKDVVTAITTDFKEPDKKYFNENSVDPTQIIRIGEDTNQTPFNQ